MTQTEPVREALAGRCEHDFTDWSESMLGFKGWGGERQHFYAPSRRCRKCGRGFYQEPGEWRPATPADTLREMAPRR